MRPRRRTVQFLLKEESQKNRWQESDVQHRIYVRPLGNTGLHIVKSRPDGAEYQVSGPTRTFRPGQFVPTGRHTGTQGETILIEPPPGKRGTAAPPTTTTGPPAAQATMTGGVISVGGTYPGFEIVAGQSDCTGLTPDCFYEITGATNRSGSPTPGFIILLSWEFQSATSVNLTLTTADSYIADGDDDDPHPGFYVNIYSDTPPTGSLIGVSGWNYLVGT